MTLSFNVKFTTVGQPLERAMGTRNARLDAAPQFALDAVKAFADVIETTAPRDTGFMADSVSQIVPLGNSGNDFGFGAGPYSSIGDPAKKAPKGTIKKFVKDYPGLRGRPPVVAKGAWWMLSRPGKEQLKQSRLQGVYGGAKPAYWYAISRGLVPDEDGNRMPANDFVEFSINHANATRNFLQSYYFGEFRKNYYFRGKRQ